MFLHGGVVTAALAGSSREKGEGKKLEREPQTLERHAKARRTLSRKRRPRQRCQRHDLW
jgi:hypothetical protein